MSAARKIGAPAVFSGLIDGNSFMDPPTFVDVYWLDYEASQKRQLLSFTVRSFMAIDVAINKATEWLPRTTDHTIRQTWASVRSAIRSTRTLYSAPLD
ncbi:hypothetical protein V502_01498 [Pseudogymnoascus sp. VKM F-4520 (FW-2644)]|nr:hypothetical protein V502_01498 [Pseudogymnoascus sp. VKM F-4520 (FW-2644)]